LSTPTVATGSGADSGTASWTVHYVVQAGDNAAPLEFAAASQLALTGDRVATDAAGNPLTLTFAGVAALSTTAQLTIDTLAPGAFDFTSPANAAVSNDNAPTLQWNDPGDVDHFRLVVSAASDCSSPVQTFASVATSSQALGTLADGTYFACLEAYDAIGNVRVATTSPLAFDVATGTWSPMVALAGFAARSAAPAIWDAGAARLHVFGGFDGASALGTGASLDPTAPAASAWTDFAADADTPTARVGHSLTIDAAGGRLFAWGGWDGANGASHVAGGAVYDVTGGADPWVTMAASPLAPRKAHSAIWTGSLLLIFGGGDASQRFGDGAAYDPSAGGSWSDLDAGDPLRPEAREAHAAAWSGSTMLIWGGRDGTTFLKSGAVYDPAGPTWTRTTDDPTTLSERAGAFAVYDSGRYLVYGGYDGTGPLADGAWYDPVASTWTPIATLGAPAARTKACVAWDAATRRLVVWGGRDGGGTPLASGAVYDAAHDRWSVPHLNAAQAPVARDGASCAFGGGVLAVWGGADATSAALDSGALLTLPAP
jgi:hypothetical protein